MQTVAKQESQSKTITDSSLIPEDVKKVMQQGSDTILTKTEVSGSLSRMLDANSDCV